MKNFLIESKPKNLITELSNQAIKLINATARITPGIAYPDMENVVKIFKNLLRETLLPQFEMKEKIIKVIEDKITKYKVFIDNSIKFKSTKFFGKIIVQ